MPLTVEESDCCARISPLLLDTVIAGSTKITWVSSGEDEEENDDEDGDGDEIENDNSIDPDVVAVPHASSAILLNLCPTARRCDPTKVVMSECSCIKQKYLERC